MKIGDKKLALILLMLSSALIVVVVFFYMPAWNEIRITQNKINDLEKSLKIVEGFVHKHSSKEYKDRLLPLKESVLAIDKIAQAGNDHRINFISIRPKDVEQSNENGFQLLPIYILLESQYKDLGLFLENLEDLEETIVNIKSVNIERDIAIYPLVSSELVLEVLLKDG